MKPTSKAVHPASASSGSCWSAPPPTPPRAAGGGARLAVRALAASKRAACGESESWAAMSAGRRTAERGR
eukprot:722351-Prymnesium_polylepis.1